MSQTKICGFKEVLLSIRGVFRIFGLNTVLKGIDLDVGEGGVLTLIGGDGTGKSALTRIIMGVYQPGGGEPAIADEKIHSFKPSVILAKGVYMVPRKPMLFPNMIMEENVLIGFKKKTRTLKERLPQIMDDIGWHLDLNRRAMSLSMAEQQLVELLRRLLRNARVLILDESTSALIFGEVGNLFKVAEDLKQKGIRIVYVTHHLAEVSQIAIHVAIIRDGIIILKGRASDFTRKMLVKGSLPPSMGVTDLKDGKGEEKALSYEELRPIFELQNYTGYGFKDIDLKVYPGEVLGVTGVVGAGRTEFIITTLGRDKVLREKTVLDDRDMTGCSTAQALEAEINHVSEDRKLNRLFAISNMTANVTSSLLRDKKMGGFFLNKKTEKEVTGRYIDDLHIKVTRQDQIAGSLSGGNQQKIIIGRSLLTNPKLAILDKPTRGIDAAARGDVYSIIHELKAQGAAIMLISSDMEEIAKLSDRAVAVFSGQIEDGLTRAEISQTSLMAASFGITEEWEQMERHESIEENNESP